jgi:MFS family permease
VYAGLSYPAGAASDIIGQKSLLAGGFVVYALVYAGWALAGTVSSIWLLFVAYGTFRALTQGVGAAYAANLAGRERRGTALGIYHGYTGLASVGASSVAGVIWTIFGPPAMFGFDAAVALVAALLLIRFSRGSPQADPS